MQKLISTKCTILVSPFKFLHILVIIKLYSLASIFVPESCLESVN
jgi:hypothetical protein